MYKLQNLSNGLRLITAPMSGTKTATILLVVGTGSKYEDSKNNGISHFLEHMFFKGTKKRPTALAISSELDGVGGEYNAFTSKEYTGYWVKVDAAKIGLAMDMVSDMILNSKFEPEEIEREKGVIIEELNMYQDNPMYYIEDVFEQCLYGDTPAGWDVIGTKENIRGFNRSDFTDYFKSQYGANNAVLCLAGKIDDKILIGVKNYFLPLKSSRPRIKESVDDKQAKPKIKLHYKKTDQAHICLGVRTFPYAHENMHVTRFISAILGSSMSSRLFIQLRERRGLAYYVRANAEFYTDSGYLAAQAGVPVDKVEESIKVILGEFKKIGNELSDPSEIRKIKDFIRGRGTIMLESSDNMANWYAKQAVMLFASKRLPDSGKSGILTPQEHFKMVEKVTENDIRKISQEIFKTEKLNLAVIGPYKDVKPFEKILKL